MEVINELELRRLLKHKFEALQLSHKIIKQIFDPSLPWEEKRSFWFYMYNTGQDSMATEALKQCLESKQRIPFDLLIDICSRANLQPGASVINATIKGLKKQKAMEDLLSAKGWDKWEARFALMRAELMEQKIAAHAQFKDNLKEKFNFLKSQRMIQQAGRVLRRMLEIYPGDEEFLQLKREFDEQWARDVLAGHIATLQAEHFERTKTETSTADHEMLKCFLLEGEKAAIEHREFALDLAIAFWFLEDYNRTLDILAWAPASAAADWMRAESLFQARRFIEALEQLNQLEVKYIADPETTFSVSYLRSQCLYALGQKATALEIMQSIVRVRTGYRSAHALILEWSEGVSWE